MNNSIRHISKQNRIGTLSFMLIFGLSLSFSNVLAQEDSKAPEKEKTAPRVSLASTQFNGDSVLLETTVKVKRKVGWQPVDFELVKFQTGSDSLLKPLGTALTNDKGIASLKIGVNQLLVGEDGLWTITSNFNGNDSTESGDASISIEAAGIELTGEKQDSLLSLTLRLFAAGTEKLPLSEIEVGFYVKRHFSNLKIGEGTTDENGMVTIECSSNIPGDSQGNIIVIAIAEDLEQYGTIVASIKDPWGVPLKDSDQKKLRELWAHAPPLWMVIVFAILMCTVWGHYFVILYKLFKLRNQ